jgi:uncharacterized protein YycO
LYIPHVFDVVVLPYNNCQFGEVLVKLSVSRSLLFAYALILSGCGASGGPQTTPGIAPQSDLKNANSTPPPSLATPDSSIKAMSDVPLGPPITHVDHLSVAQQNVLRAQGGTDANLAQINAENDHVNVILKEEVTRKPQFFRDEKFEQLKADTRKTQAYVYNDARTRPGVYYVTIDNFFSGLPIPGHAAMVSRYPNYTIEAYGNTSTQYMGVKYHYNEWTRRHYLARTANYTNANLDVWAAIYAEQQINKPYNYNFYRPMDTDRFYCSSLIWNAFRLYTGVDIAGFGWSPFYVSPYHLYISSNAHTIYQQ